MSHASHVVVADTNVVCEHPDKLEVLDLAGMLGLRYSRVPDRSIELSRVVVPEDFNP